MWTRTLLIVTLIFVVASTGHGFARQVKSHAQFGSSTFTSSLNASNGSALQGILQELHMSTHIQQLGCHSSHGPFGGSGGRAFNELPDDCEAVVDRIRIRSGRRLDSIQITYKLSNGRTYTGRKYGENGGSPHTVDIRVDEAERIIGVFGKSGRKVDQIGFVTNFGRVLGPYGGNGGSDFRVDGCNLRGIFGRHGDEIDSIGFHCS